MALLLGTHSGSFHADDVLAAALIRAFLDPDAEVVRSRDPEVLAKADIVFDVGHVFDPETGRFDHHQREYEGERSSAGMVLDHLEAKGAVAPELAARYREELVDYVDAVDIGARQPEHGVPCFSMIVGVLNERAGDDFDRWYERAVSLALDVVEGIRAGFERAEADAEAVRKAMATAESEGRRALQLDRYLKWKPAYFAAGGAEHPTDLVLFPGRGDWRLVTIPIAEGSREDKVKLPETWAGLEGEALVEASGISGARFCHRNRFIAAFDSESAALEGIAQVPAPSPPSGDS
ncbi:MAG: MYG1 family protein [Deltaproteobacteria bacterium]|nr:MYG1 family protein [Deltaproteobacteria bacterium]